MMKPADTNSSFLILVSNSPDAIGSRVDVGLAKILSADKRYSEYSTRAKIRLLIDIEQIQINGVVPKPSSKLKRNDRVVIWIPATKTSTIEAENAPIEIVYEDGDILIINKPQGLSVHPTPHHMSGTLVNRLLYYLKDMSTIGGVFRPGIVHRLDKDTSGLLLIAKNDAAHLALSQQFHSHSIHRRYLALTYNKFGEGKQRRIESLIGRNPADRKKMSTKVKTGRSAISNFRRLESFELIKVSNSQTIASLVEAQLETGRTHQIRVHLTDLGSSIMGDRTYGIPSKTQQKWSTLPIAVQSHIMELPGQALHAQELGFNHPRTLELLKFSVEPPKPFLNLLECLRHDDSIRTVK